MPPLPYKYWCTIVGMIITPLFGRLALHGSGHEYELLRYSVPFFVGGTAGFLIGLQSDRISDYVYILKKEIAKHKQSEERYNALFKRNHTPILLVSPENGQILDANPAAAHFYGHSLSSLNSMTIGQLDKTPAKRLISSLKDALKNNRKVINSVHRLADGDERNIEMNAGKIQIEDTPCLLLVINDVTEVKILRDIIPVCSSCKKIRKDKEYWSQLELYTQTHSLANLSRSICPKCTDK